MLHTDKQPLEKVRDSLQKETNVQSGYKIETQSMPDVSVTINTAPGSKIGDFPSVSKATRFANEIEDKQPNTEFNYHDQFVNENFIQQDERLR